MCIVCTKNSRHAFKIALLIFPLFTCVCPDEDYEADAMLGAVCISLEGKLEDYPGEDLNELLAAAHRCIAELLQIDMEKLVIRLLSGGSILLVLTLPAQDVVRLLKLWKHDQQRVKAAFSDCSVGSHPVRILSITNVLGSRNWPLKDYMTVDEG